MHDPKTLAQIIGVLEKLNHLPTPRPRPQPGDLEGDYDAWFDGGAAKIMTGWTTYTFADGSRATLDTCPIWRVQVDLDERRKFVLVETHGEYGP